jgi:hypothetical protein
MHQRLLPPLGSILSLSILSHEKGLVNTSTTLEIFAIFFCFYLLLCKCLVCKITHMKLHQLPANLLTVAHKKIQVHAVMQRSREI